MSNNSVERFMAALGPEDRKSVASGSAEERARLAADWERELAGDDELDVLDEVSPSAAEAEAARRVLGHEGG
ncbi:hypothetical protein ACGFS9_19490 [Streptomyces sp. NPDC048566]|uniref:hypothetical protein n=1 Tax=Streptomyces sp. NPDC048566 TaxID=3365569 RepID=UPI00371E94B6